MADLNSALQVMLAYKHVVLNLLIGTTTVFVLWWLLGGRTFCSWVCPYHLIAEWAESLHLKLAAHLDPVRLEDYRRMPSDRVRITTLKEEQATVPFDGIKVDAARQDAETAQGFYF